ncbi:hypothetical protein CR513_01555, partial [Mucuna pruriens]
MFDVVSSHDEILPIGSRETTPVIGDNVHNIVLDIVPEQDYDEVLPQTPIEQLQQPQEVSLRRSIRERRHAIPNDYIIFFQEHEDVIGLTEDYPINFCQAMQSSNSQKWIDVMKDELKFMQNNDVWDFIELLEEDSFRIVMAQVAHFDLKLHQMDVKIAFLSGDIDETIYMMQLENFVSNESKSMCPNNDLERNEIQKISYASTVGSLMYAQFCIRPNIAFVVGVLSRNKVDD